ncbi:MAG: hypothetical protein AAF266_06595 [Planctomycetota bacterium]
MNATQLANELLSNDPSRRREAADRLATLGEEAKSATVALVEACDDDSLRDLCVGALEELGTPPTNQLPQLAALLRSPNDTVAYWAATLLGRSKSDAADHLADLERLSIDAKRSKAVQDRAAWAIEKVQPAR